MATPSTVYGDELVAFDISSKAPAGASVKADVKDELGRSVHQAQVLVPGQLRLPSVPSGDYVLVLASSSVSCRVTVNRELSRSSPAPR